MYRILRERQNEGREDGFTLIELLVVVIIIGILAAIAIPVFLNQRERAWTSAVESDLRNGAVAMEAYYTDAGDYDAPDAAALTDSGMTVSQDVTVSVYSTGQAYCLHGVHANLGADPVRAYTSVDGGFADVDNCEDHADFAATDLQTTVP